MEQIYPLYREADVVVLASPLYYWSISGFLKNAFDRLFAIAGVTRITVIRKKQSLGKILCGYVTQPGDIEGKKE